MLIQVRALLSVQTSVPRRGIWRSWRQSRKAILAQRDLAVGRHPLHDRCMLVLDLRLKQPEPEPEPAACGLSSPRAAEVCNTPHHHIVALARSGQARS
jgi:hypothetical protein